MIMCSFDTSNYTLKWCKGNLKLKHLGWEKINIWMAPICCQSVLNFNHCIRPAVRTKQHQYMAWLKYITSRPSQVDHHCWKKSLSWWRGLDILPDYKHYFPTYLQLASKRSKNVVVALLCLLDVTEDLNQITVILWQGKSLEPVRCCRSFGPSTSHRLPEPWLLGCPRNIERARRLSKGGQEEHRSLRAKGNNNVFFRQLWKGNWPVQCSRKQQCTVRLPDFAPEIQGRKRKLQTFLLQRDYTD